MRNRNLRWALTALTVVAAVFVAVGGPATAARWIDGGDIKPGSIPGRQTGDGAISANKLSRRARRALRGPSGARGASGATGPAGPAGPAGQNGARGPAGALNVADATGKVLGMFAGWYTSSGYYEIYTPEGALLTYEPSVSTDYPLTLAPPVLYYRSTDCSGTAYGIFTSYPVESAIMLGSPARPGAAIYVLQAGPPQSFTYESVKSASPSCTTSRGSTSSLLPARQAGTVPIVQKPFQLVPAG